MTDTLPAPKRKSARFRLLLPSIEARIVEKYTQEEIVDWLHTKGLDLNVGTFKVYLHRYGNKEEKSEPQQAPTRAPQVVNQPRSQESLTQPDGNLESGTDASQPSLDVLLDASKREQANEQYFTTNPLFKRKPK